MVILGIKKHTDDIINLPPNAIIWVVIIYSLFNWR